jgi:hypothetical protein
MPLTSKGEEVMSAMKKQYGGEKGEEVFYASKNKGTLTGVDEAHPNEPAGGLKGWDRDLGKKDGAVKEPNDRDFAEHQRMVQKMNQQQREFIRNKQTGRSDELSPLSDRADVLSQRADTVADRAFESARQDAVRSARADTGLRAHQHFGDAEGEHQRQQPRRDAEGEVTVTAKAHNPATGKVDKEVTYKARNMAEAQNWAKFNKDYMQDFKFKRSDAEGEYLRQRKDVGFNLAEIASPAQNESIPDRSDANFADPWVVQFQDPEGYSQPPPYTVRATDREAAVKKARELLSSRWAETPAQRNRAKSFTLKSISH